MIFVDDFVSFVLSSPPSVVSNFLPLKGSMHYEGGLRSFEVPWVCDVIDSSACQMTMVMMHNML